MNQVNALLNFWFGDPQDPDSGYGQPRPIWFQKSAEFDAELRQRFLADYEVAAAGELTAWLQTPRSLLALVLLLDQLPRNLFRGQAASFATDPQARQVAQAALDQGFDQQVSPVERAFLYLPFEHSEELADQQLAVELFAALVQQRPDLASYYDYALRHYQVVERFGRFPHRNQILGRQTTPAELEFLQQPGARF